MTEKLSKLMIIIFLPKNMINRILPAIANNAVVCNAATPRSGVFQNRIGDFEIAHSIIHKGFADRLFLLVMI